MNVCPGVYHQHVLIDKSLTLQGVANGNSAATIIVPPLTSSKANLHDAKHPNAAHLAVNGPAEVNIRDVTVDGSNNLLSDPDCSDQLVGILYRNATGTISHVAVRNQYATNVNCSSGIGLSAILVNNDPVVGHPTSRFETAVSIFCRDGILALFSGTTVQITNNTISNAGNTSSPETNRD